MEVEFSEPFNKPNPQLFEHHHCLIIGGGIAGLMAATILQNNGLRVTVLDKGRGIGGRLATRRMSDDAVEDGVFDYGAQYFTTRDSRFKSWVQQWLEKGIIRQWSKGFVTQECNIKFNAEPRYIGSGGMRDIAKHLAKNMSVHTQTRVTKLTIQEKGWEILTEQGNSFSSNSLLLTPPLPQSLSLLRESALPLPDNTEKSLQKVKFFSCIALLTLLKSPTNIPDPGGMWGKGDPIQWMADNQKKGISPSPAVTIHSSPEFSKYHWDTDDKYIAQKLIKAARTWIEGEEVVQYQVHRWRYSQSSIFAGNPYVYLEFPAPLLMAGDAFNSGRVEGAAISGISAAEKLLEVVT